VALLATVGDVDVYIADSDGCGRLVGPVKDKLEITGIMTVGTAVRIFAS
jgi:hypothetical protein